MNLSKFDFVLPRELIAQAPAAPRDHARLLVYDREKKQITDDYFYNLDKYLVPGTTLVLNDSKVEKSRLRFGNIEIFVTQTINPTTVEALVRPGKKFRLGNKITLDMQSGLSAKTIAISDDGLRTLELGKPLHSPAFDKYRLTPFPPYIAQDESLANQYQTVYARPLGSKAAPTAGLHFTDKQLVSLGEHHAIAKLTLHVGLGTFAPVKDGDINQHKMHSEDYFVTAETAEILNRAKSITAVGTTSLRVLETLQKPFKETTGSTDIFIRPGYKFKAVDSLITNFHLPKSTLLILVAAFLGSTDEMHRIYGHAIERKYRFYSFGDAMLVL
jgi:S-adenosylmethionine:tRNA ribosyltransferase-isomerase